MAKTENEKIVSKAEIHNKLEYIDSLPLLRAEEEVKFISDDEILIVANHFFIVKDITSFGYNKKKEQGISVLILMINGNELIMLDAKDSGVLDRVFKKILRLNNYQP